MLRTLAEYEVLAAQAHGHLCAGQILGIRLALHGLGLLGIADPTGEDRKRLVTFVEIDRCATDAIALVTGCRLGKRALKFKDFGKVAATFRDLASGRAVRVLAREDARRLAAERYPDVADAREQQMRAYRELADGDLFEHRWVLVPLAAEDMPGFRAPRVVCEECGEAVGFRREVEWDGRTLCRACAGERYYEPL